MTEYRTTTQTSEPRSSRDWTPMVFAIASAVATASICVVGWFVVSAIREHAETSRLLRDRLVSQGLVINEALKKIEGRPPVIGGATPADYSDHSPDSPQSGTSDSIEDAFFGTLHTGPLLPQQPSRQ